MYENKYGAYVCIAAIVGYAVFSIAQLFAPQCPPVPACEAVP